ncbi:Hsp20/alpha crystallin family protein [Burkholderia ubonensis]|uniref:Heat-shock protein n=1 Tax=Burkholderia ubonensis TaxID=101571 RepID=A0A1R1J2B7_9BURK|nr:Hsp20/alpha crystallin family protein [Burkholderia ubonensis]OMG69463.1 heat-shock protein [Burkholderia ubonensis]
MSDANELTQRGQSAVTQGKNGRSARRATIRPAVDVYEDSQGATLWVDLPGVTKDKLDVRVHDDRLSIEAEAVVRVPPNFQLQHAEVQEPRFARTFVLSADFDSSRIDANLQDGVLKLTIPRREEARPRRIEVQTG